MWIVVRIFFMEQMINDSGKREEKNAATAVSIATALAEQFASRADEADKAGALPTDCLLYTSRCV